MQPRPSRRQLLHSGVGSRCCCFWKGWRAGGRGLLLAAPSIFPSLTAFWPWFPTSYPLKPLGTNMVWIEGLNVACAMTTQSCSTKLSLNSNQSTWGYECIVWFNDTMEYYSAVKRNEYWYLLQHRWILKTLNWVKEKRHTKWWKMRQRSYAGPLWSWVGATGKGKGRTHIPSAHTPLIGSQIPQETHLPHFLLQQTPNMTIKPGCLDD